MTLVDEYRRQFAWRDWNTALSICPTLPGQQILDLGCGSGDITAQLFRRGCLVTGIDGNPDLSAAKEKSPGCTFKEQDLGSLSLTPQSFDGLWSSFTAAYFTHFKATFSNWLKFLKKDAWVCITDIDDLSGHLPLSPKTQARIQDFYQDAIDAGRYDFQAGRKIQNTLEENGFKVIKTVLKDQELSFDGPVDPLVVQAWSDRLDRMGGLKSFLKEDFSSFRKEFLQSLLSENHRSVCKVICCVGTRT
jgi:ubiquinone/menaquinone biosynthesis C-methylase UbiE